MSPLPSNAAVSSRVLCLLRHALSAPADDSVGDDHERPLRPRGRHHAAALGEYAAEYGLAPEVVLCSTALRARQTWEAMADRVAPRPAVIYERELYGASPEDIVRVLGRLAREPDTVLVIGHNPGIGELTRRLVETAPLDFPSGALAVFRCRIERWDDLESDPPGARCELESFLRPEELEELERSRS